MRHCCALGLSHSLLLSYVCSAGHAFHWLRIRLWLRLCECAHGSCVCVCVRVLRFIGPAERAATLRRRMHIHERAVSSEQSRAEQRQHCVCVCVCLLVYELLMCACAYFALSAFLGVRVFNRKIFFNSFFFARKFIIVAA